MKGVHNNTSDCNSITRFSSALDASMVGFSSFSLIRAWVLTAI